MTVIKRVHNNPPNQRRKVTLPKHLWALLDLIAELETEAFAEMKGEGAYAVSDVIKNAVDTYIALMRADLGKFPKSSDERTEYVKRLAAWNEASYEGQYDHEEH